MYSVGEGTRPCLFPVTENGHGRVTEPKGDQFSGYNLGVIPEVNWLLEFARKSQPILGTFEPILGNVYSVIFGHTVFLLDQ